MLSLLYGPTHTCVHDCWKIHSFDHMDLCTKSWTWLRDFTFTFHFHALEKEMATHSSVLAWTIPRMAGPGGLPSLGLHRVRHDWSDLAAVAAAASLSSYFNPEPSLDFVSLMLSTELAQSNHQINGFELSHFPSSFFLVTESCPFFPWNVSSILFLKVQTLITLSLDLSRIFYQLFPLTPG